MAHWNFRKILLASKRAKISLTLATVFQLHLNL